MLLDLFTPSDRSKSPFQMSRPDLAEDQQRVNKSVMIAVLGDYKDRLILSLVFLTTLKLCYMVGRMQGPRGGFWAI